jgi:hypothetical protein
MITVRLGWLGATNPDIQARKSSYRNDLRPRSASVGTIWHLFRFPAAVLASGGLGLSFLDSRQNRMAGIRLRPSIKRRFAERPTAMDKLEFQVRSVRPSLVDWRFTGDVWIVDEGDGNLALRLGDYELAHITGLPLDLPTLNSTLQHVWNRRPRQR